MGNELPALFFEKLKEQTERLDHLLSMVPPDKLSWRPPLESKVFPLDMLLGHLLECLAGFCATLYALYPDQLAYFARLRDLPVNHHCSVEEARLRIHSYLTHIEAGFLLLSDEDLAHSIPTVFVPEGEAVLTLLLGNLEHLINHKQQLFFYLKMLGVPVTTRDIYHWRGKSQTKA